MTDSLEEIFDGYAKLFGCGDDLICEACEEILEAYDKYPREDFIRWLKVQGSYAGWGQ